MIISTLLAVLEGCTRAAASMPWGRLGPIRLPEEVSARHALVEAHVEGPSATVIYCPSGEAPRSLKLGAVVLYAYCPAADGLCRWVGFDLDAVHSHGAGGLMEPHRAAACIAEQCAAAGLFGGLVVARSAGGAGRHLWLIAPAPVPLADAVFLVAGLAARALSIAENDAAGSDRAHAFVCGDGSIATLGKSGSVELLPRSTDRPAFGWSLMLPSPGALADRGGGLIIDPFSDPPTPVKLTHVPSCDPRAWQTFLDETRHALVRRQVGKPLPPNAGTTPVSTHAMDRLDPRTRVFLDGRCPVGQRDHSLYVAVCNMIGVGVPRAEAQRLALQGALACGLPEREARATIRSALHAKGTL